MSTDSTGSAGSGDSAGSGGSGEVVADAGEWPRQQPVSAVERYKEITGLATEAVERMRQQDRERAAELERELVESQGWMAQIAEQERVVQLGARLHWEAAVKALWNERWLEMTPMPTPNRSVPEHDQLHFDAEVERTFQNLEAALQRRGLLRRK